MALPTEDPLVATLRAFTEAQSDEEMRQIFDAHPELLSDECFQLLHAIMSALQERGETQAEAFFRRYYDLLLRAREVGLDQALREAVKRASGITPELEVILTELRGPVPPTDQMPRRIQLIEQALSMLGDQQNPTLVAGLQGLLGDALNRTTEGNRAENIDRAIQAYEKSAQILQQQDRPFMWAHTTNSLAGLYAQRINGERVENLDRALSDFRQALTVLTDEKANATMTDESVQSLMQLATGSQADLEKAVENLGQMLNFMIESGSR